MIYFIKEDITKKQYHVSNFLLILSTILFILNTPVKSVDHHYFEDFTTTQYKDTLSTTANWDTINGELKLHDFEYNLVGGYNTTGYSYDVFISGDYAYVADGASGLVVIDISDPSSPTLAGSYNTPDLAYKVTVCGDYAYIANRSSGLQVIDISDPTNPTSAGNYDTPGYAFGIAIAGDYAYIADYDSGLQVLDITNPTNPTFAGYCDTPGNAYDITISGNYAYIADYYKSGLQVVDISDPTNPISAGSCDTYDAPFDVAICGNYAYMANGNSGLQVIDISDPTNPLLRGNYNTPSTAAAVSVNGDYIYVADWSSGIQIINISDPTNPVFDGSYNTPGTAEGIYINGEYAYVADGGNGLQVIQINCSPHPRLIGSYTVPYQSIYGIAIDGDYAYIANDHSGLQVLNISDPANPSFAGSHDTTMSFALSIVVDCDYAYVADASYGLVVFDISDPTNPIWTGNYTFGQIMGQHSPVLVTMHGDYLYLNEYMSGIRVIDISNPLDPDSLGYAEYGDSDGFMVISGDYLYYDGGAGIQVLDIKNPTTPTLVASLPLPSHPNSIVIDGDYIFAAAVDSGLLVIDISDPTNLSLVSRLDTPGNAWGIAISGDFVFIADGDSGIQVIDISDPLNPKLTENYKTSFSPFRIKIYGANAYIADQNYNFKIVEIFQHYYDSKKNIGQSEVLNNEIGEIKRVRLLTTQSDSINWFLSPNNGTDWEAVTPNGSWHRFPTMGDQLRWRSNHIYTGNGINPACSNLEIDWLYNFALIDSIVDVPNDQGSWLRIYFTRSGLDFTDETEYPITEYYVFRRIDDINLHKKILQFGQPVLERKDLPFSDRKELKKLPDINDHTKIYSWEDRCFLITNTSTVADLPPGTWEVVGNVPSHQQEQYIYLVPALQDSSTNLQYSVFCISAETSTPSVFYFSPPDSAYSVDNIPPSVPHGLQTSVIDSSIELTWHRIPDNDLHYYAIYRSTTSGFVPDNSNLLATTTDTVYYDTQILANNTYYYRISAFDYAGNESEYSTESSCLYTNIKENVPVNIPESFFLSQNYPNPFNPTTEIKYGLSENCRVLLEVYNTRGQKVLTLINEQQSAGYKSIRLDASSLTSGVYFYRLRTKDFVKSKKMILLK